MNSDKIFGWPRSYYEEHGAIHTAEEIVSQPILWKRLADDMEAQKEKLCAFMEKIEGIPNIRIIFTGAGSSAFVGESLSNMLAGEIKLHSENIHTTDIVASPDMTLLDMPTLLISYARSGESPESRAAIEFAEKKIKNLYQVVIVCEEDSALAKKGLASVNTLVLVMPKGSNDKGFAMTSSVSCMSLATYCLFHHRELEQYCGYVRILAESTEKEMEKLSKDADEVADFTYRRLIWLGCGALRGLAREASVKSMELTNGYVHAGYDTPTGFRHGPKTVIDDTTMTVHFVSNIKYTASYDKDFIREMIGEQKNNKIITVKQYEDKKEDEAGDYEVLYEIPEGLKWHSEMGAYIKGLVFLQLVSLKKSLKCGFTPDSPCPGGEVNRVVLGVMIHDI